MIGKRIALAVVLSLCLVPSAQGSGGQWLIEGVQGKWEVREGNQRPHVMGKFEILTAKSKVRCLKLPCVLTYSTSDGATKPLPLPQSPPARLNQWLDVREPSGTPAGPRAAGLQAIIAKIGTRAGRQKDSPVCSGTLPLLAPTCGELIDPVDFKLQWLVRPSEAGKLLTLLVGGADTSEKKRWNAIQAGWGEFRTKTLEEYLLNLELPDRATDVTIRLMRTESLDAIRLVRLPSRPDDAEYRKRLKTLSLLPDLTRNLAMLDQFLKAGMWSKAAEVSHQLLGDAPDSLEIRKYALVGLCRSGFVEEIAKLRGSLRDAGVTGFCDTEGPLQ
jgi:hypothetical protein